MSTGTHMMRLYKAYSSSVTNAHSNSHLNNPLCGSVPVYQNYVPHKRGVKNLIFLGNSLDIHVHVCLFLFSLVSINQIIIE